MLGVGDGVTVILGSDSLLPEAYSACRGGPGKQVGRPPCHSLAEMGLTVKISPSSQRGTMNFPSASKCFEGEG